MEKMKKSIFYISLSILVFYCIPACVSLSQVQLLTHDYLDSNLLWAKILSHDSNFWKGYSEIISELLLGVPRGCFPSKLNAFNLIFVLFDVPLATAITYCFVHFVAFFSLYGLMNSLFKDLATTPILIILKSLSALSFALIPFWIPAGWSIAMMPAVLLALKRVYNNKEFDLISIVIIVLYPFGALFIFTTIWFLVVASVFLFILTYRRWFFEWRVWSLIILLLVISCISEYQLFQIQFSENFETQRNFASNLNFAGFLWVSFQLFLKGQYHAYISSFPVLINLTYLFMAIWLIPRRKVFGFFWVLIIVAGFSSTLVFRDWTIGGAFLNELGFLKSIQFRFYTLLPVFWALLPMVIYKSVILNKLKQGWIDFYAWLLIAIFFLQIFSSFSNIGFYDYQDSKFADNRFYSNFLEPNDSEYSSINEFYDLNDYNNILVERGEGVNRIICIGVKPQVLQWYGFQTVGGYYPYYPKSNYERLSQFNAGFYSACFDKQNSPRLDFRKVYFEWMCDSLSLDSSLLEQLRISQIISNKSMDETEVYLDGNIFLAGEKCYVYSLKNVNE